MQGIVNSTFSSVSEAKITAILLAGLMVPSIKATTTFAMLAIPLFGWTSRYLRGPDLLAVCLLGGKIFMCNTETGSFIWKYASPSRMSTTARNTTSVCFIKLKLTYESLNFTEVFPTIFKWCNKMTPSCGHWKRRWWWSLIRFFREHRFGLRPPLLFCLFREHGLFWQSLNSQPENWTNSFPSHSLRSIQPLVLEDGTYCGIADPFVSWNRKFLSTIRWATTSLISVRGPFAPANSKQHFPLRYN